MKIALVQPPFTQLNAPYPAVFYLRSFLASRGMEAEVRDHGIELFHAIYSSSGLRRIFADAAVHLDRLIDEAEGQAAANLRRYRANSARYVETIEPLVDFLAGKNGEWGHVIASGNFPYGYRVEAFLEGKKLPLSRDESRIAATLVLDDLADFIRYVLDEEFALVKYGDSMASSRREFAPLESALESSYILPAFYGPLADSFLAHLASGGDEPVALCLSLPFPGTVLPAMYLAKKAKALLGSRCSVIWGGGYVNTELRYVKAKAFFGYCDYLAFDKGYAALAAILERIGCGKPAQDSGDPSAGFYRTLTLEGERVGVHRMAPADYPVYRDDPAFVVDEAAEPMTSGASAVGEVRNPASSGVPRDPVAVLAEALETGAVRGVFPDYSGLDFSRYLYIAESENPMHRLWSDGRWLKAYLAYGCYHRRCAFCDVSLDYIGGYRPTDTDGLFAHLMDQRHRTGQSGIHFVDEALPPAHLLRFAKLNLEAGRPLSFWGNIRFERAFGWDAAMLLASSGLLGVSAGIEVATDSALDVIGKGMTLEDIVAVCLAFGENTVLVHSYLMYGYYTESPKDVIDSMEAVRQLFEAGLVGSAFWHRFVLTRHSRANRERLGGLAPNLKVAELPWDFASNDLSFEGEQRFERYDEGLDAALYNWMEGRGLDRPVRDWFDFPVPHPGIPRDLISKYAERGRERMAASLSASEPSGSVWWLGGEPLVEPGPKGAAKLSWFYRNREQSIALPRAAADCLLEALGKNGTARVPDRERAANLVARLDGLSGGPRAFHETPAFRKLRRGGLAFI
jgi:radical SAM superfamily enzyme YgiQ (UPF0313 family)